MVSADCRGDKPEVLVYPSTAYLDVVCLANHEEDAQKDADPKLNILPRVAPCPGAVGSFICSFWDFIKPETNLVTRKAPTALVFNIH